PDIFSTSREELARLYEQMIAGELSAPTVKGQYRRKDGSQLPVEAYPRAVRSGEGHVIVSIARDVRERLAAEETLRRFRLSMDNSADMIVLIVRATILFESTRHVLRSGDSYIIAAISRDISERLASENALRESEERFRSLTVLSTDMYWEQDDQFRFTSMSGTGSQRVNVKTFSAIGKKRWEQNYINMTADQWAEHMALLEAHKPFRDMELCRLDETGKKIWISISGEPVFDAAGAFTGYRGVGKDISERKTDEERIHFLANHDALTS